MCNAGADISRAVDSTAGQRLVADSSAGPRNSEKCEMRLIPLVPLRLLLSSAALLASASAFGQTPAPTTTAPATTAPPTAPAGPAAAAPAAQTPAASSPATSPA